MNEIEWDAEHTKRYLEKLKDVPGWCLETAALCLHNQEFGFTREDVEAIQHALAHRGVEQGSTEWDRWKKLGELADRIEALLPPEAP